MTIEARELYCYANNTKPFADMIQAKWKFDDFRIIVSMAASQYVRDYCTDGESCFTQDDIDSATVEVYINRNNKKNICTGCKYFDGCGEIDRTVPCEGRDGK